MSETAKLKKLLCSNNLPTLNQITKHDGSLTNSDEETLNEMATTLLGPTRTEQIKIKKNKEPDKKTINSIITQEKIKKAISQLKKKKAPGPDQITNEMLKNAEPLITEELELIYKSCLYHEYTPDSWQSSTGAILAKPGKARYDHPKSFRIISLTSNLLKMMETLILWHLVNDLNLQKNLHSSQHGFRPGYSTETALLKTINKIQKHTRRGEHVFGIFLDIQGAFDNIPFKAIQKALDETEAKGTISNWITNMVQNRTTKLKLRNSAIKHKIAKGCPQGGVLSPLLWNLVLDKLLNKYKNLYDIIAYADDILLIQAGTDISTTKSLVKQKMTEINNWCNNQGLQISALKTQIMLWGKNIQNKPTHIKHDEMTIELARETKYLGLTIDEKLNWNSHITKTTKKCKRILGACIKAIGKTWGISNDKIMWLYKTIILPTLSYGAVIWGLYLTNQHIQKLEPLQNQITNRILNCTKSTPKVAQNIILNLQCIENHIKKTCLSRAIKIRNQGHWESYSNQKGKYQITPVMQKIDNKLIEIMKSTHSTKTDDIIPCLNTSTNFKTT